MQDTRQLAQAPLTRLLAKMSAHTTLSLLLYSVYGLTDTLLVAHGVGSHAAGAVSLASPLMLLSAVSTTTGAGGASVVSRALGKEDTQLAA